ncbi:protein of unknown function [Acidithiobacillus ferrivorans]|uniref:Uncharacterized protein n=1 Tax=Acidithiobacillus ferrivorans TaxID=160808 RepID=A0ABY1MMR0_9PROT|nr:protein of unknown function [Acidithiobacillus ferrivorans]
MADDAPPVAGAVPAVEWVPVPDDALRVVAGRWAWEVPVWAESPSVRAAGAAAASPCEPTPPS